MGISRKLKDFAIIILHTHTHTYTRAARAHTYMCWLETKYDSITSRKVEGRRSRMVKTTFDIRIAFISPNHKCH